MGKKGGKGKKKKKRKKRKKKKGKKEEGKRGNKGGEGGKKKEKKEKHVSGKTQRYVSQRYSPFASSPALPRSAMLPRPFPPEVPPRRQTGSAPRAEAPPRASILLTWPREHRPGAHAWPGVVCVRTYVRACEAGRRAVPYPAGRGRAHGRKEEAAILERRVAITRHPVGARGFFYLGEGERGWWRWGRGRAPGWARGWGSGQGGRRRPAGPCGLRHAAGAPRPGGAEGPRSGRGAAGRAGSGGAAGPEPGAGPRRCSPPARAVGPRAGAAPLFAGGRCRCGAAALGGQRWARRGARGPRRSVRRWGRRRSAARVRRRQWAPWGSRGRMARPLCAGPARHGSAEARESALRSGTEWGWGRPPGCGPRGKLFCGALFPPDRLWNGGASWRGVRWFAAFGEVLFSPLVCVLLKHSYEWGSLKEPRGSLYCKYLRNCCCSARGVCDCFPGSHGFYQVNGNEHPLLKENLKLFLVRRASRKKHPILNFHCKIRIDAHGNSWAMGEEFAFLFQSLEMPCNTPFIFCRNAFLGGGASSFSVALSVTTNSPGQQHHFLFLWKVLS